MTGKLVPTIRTTATKLEFIKSLIDGWNKIYGKLPKKENIAVIYAQWSLETGQGVSCWNWNLGNIKYVANTSDTEATQYCMLKGVFEYVNGKRVNIDPPNPATWFRSFDTLAHGVTFYFNFLRNQRYKIAWTAVEAGDPSSFSKLLRQQGYYTAPEATYTSLMVKYFNQFMKDTSFEQALAELNPPVVGIPVPVIVTPEPELPVEQPIAPPVITPITTVPVATKPGFFDSIGQVLSNIFSAFKRN